MRPDEAHSHEPRLIGCVCQPLQPLYSHGRDARIHTLSFALADVRACFVAGGLARLGQGLGCPRCGVVQVLAVVVQALSKHIGLDALVLEYLGEGLESGVGLPPVLASPRPVVELSGGSPRKETCSVGVLVNH